MKPKVRVGYLVLTNNLINSKKYLVILDDLFYNFRGNDS